MKKTIFCFTLIVLLAIPSFTVLQTVNAISTSKPTVPQYTVACTGDFYDVPPQTIVNPYTGKAEISSPGYHVQNITITLTIKNQPFTVYTDLEGNIVSLFYLVQVRGHFNGSWWYPIGNADSRTHVCYVKAQGESTNTVLSFGGPSTYGQGYNVLGAPPGGEMEFRVQAFIGYVKRINDSNGWPPGYETCHYEFTGETSDYGSIQTVKLPNDPTKPLIDIGAIGSDIQISTNTLLAVIAGLLAVIVALLFWIGVTKRKANKHA